tara:strand:+ start:8049 stop:10157 length:2109 start_codon:yes stop_codon:yes gene_type:complete
MTTKNTKYIQPIVLEGDNKYAPKGGWSKGVPESAKNWYYIRTKTADKEGGLQETDTDLGNTQLLSDGSEFRTGTRYGLTFKKYLSFQHNTTADKLTVEQARAYKTAFDMTDEKFVDNVFKKSYFDKYKLSEIKDKNVASTIYDAMVNQGYNLGGGNTDSTLQRVLGELGVTGDNSNIDNAILAINSAIDKKGADMVLTAYNTVRQDSYLSSKDIDDSALGWFTRLNSFKLDINKLTPVELTEISALQKEGKLKPSDKEGNKAAIGSVYKTFESQQKVIVDDKKAKHDAIQAGKDALDNKNTYVQGDYDLEDILRRQAAGEELSEAELNYSNGIMDKAFIDGDEEALEFYNNAKKASETTPLMTNEELLVDAQNQIAMPEPDPEGGLARGVQAGETIAGTAEADTGYVSGDSTEQDKQIRIAEGQLSHEERVKQMLEDTGSYNEDGTLITEEQANKKEAARQAKLQAEKDAKNASKLKNAEMALTGLKAAAGILSLSQALKAPEVETPELSPLLLESLQKSKELAESGMTSKEKSAAMQNLNDAYAGAMKNVLRASGGQRGMFLANQGVVDAGRIQGLNQLASEDAKLKRQNVKQYNALANSVGTLQMNRDMSVETMRQATINNNRKTLSGIGGNLLSDALSDVGYYLSPNREKMMNLTSQLLDQTSGSGTKAEVIDTPITTASLYANDVEVDNDKSEEIKPE